MMRGMARPPSVHVSDRLRAPLRPSSARLRDVFFSTATELTLGAVRGERWRLRTGPLVWFEFDEPAPRDGGWSWPIRGGLLVRRAGGAFSVRWREGELVAAVTGYSPRVPLPLYLAAQLPFHHLVTRLFLLRLRGRVPAPGVPAGPAQRLLAAGVDVALCGAGALLLARRRRLAAFLGLATAYHLLAWTAAGRTVGGSRLGQRLVAVDGGRVTAVQAAIRLALMPVALARLRAVHDAAASTEVVETTG